jgi:dynein assembly factor 5
MLESLAWEDDLRSINPIDHDAFFALRIYNIFMQREINILNEISSDRNQKKLALQKLLAFTKENEAIEISILQPILRTLVDPIEKCRELSVLILHQLAGKADSIVVLKDLLPVLVKQLGSKEIKETSEEIRLELVRLLNVLVLKSARLDAFIPDLVTILSKTSLDTFQDIRKESFKCMIALCKDAATMAHQTSTVVKLILPSLSHRHFSVRCAALQALDVVVIVDATAIDDTIEPLRTLTRDKSPQVRNQVYILAKDWLTKLIDRHVYGFKILPLLYAGLTDEIVNLQSTCQEFMEIVAELYERENNQKIKDELDYTDGIVRESNWYPNE